MFTRFIYRSVCLSCVYVRVFVGRVSACVCDCVCFCVYVCVATCIFSGVCYASVMYVYI